jgi:hypothetical protein
VTTLELQPSARRQSAATGARCSSQDKKRRRVTTLEGCGRPRAVSPLQQELNARSKIKNPKAAWSEATELKPAQKIPGGQIDRPVFLLEGRKKEREEDY